ncbi:flagellar assembly protein FliH [Steroidobacter denitrificans]|uniref:Flagellar assembly protein FliH n=1 Tax=Steroidobacter denitrificans TaxID=465721 RepID=A0A127FAI6_STEDE|nr:flagellar assembly protein FliH [Steroidobacter denitrificans]AMN46600.1 flagellar assembly protein FliH [Steroidobacter denitrificans]
MSAVSLWDLPSIRADGPGHRIGRTVGELEEIERRAFDEAYAKGHEAGHAAGLAAGTAAAQLRMQPRLAEIERQVESLQGMLASLSRPFQEFDLEVQEQLVQLALSIARHLVRRELRIEPAQVIAIIRETVGLLPAAARDVRVHLHPQDAALVREKLASPGVEPAWTLLEDPVMSRGGCRVTTQTAQIDARLETRIQAVAGALLGGEEREDAARPIRGASLHAAADVSPGAPPGAPEDPSRPAESS